MKNILLGALVLSCFQFGYGQNRFFTKTGIISFEAGTAVEDIDAVNKSTTSIFDASSGQYEFAVLVNGFEFKRALMQQHFNEDYMESDKYPKAFLKGTISNIAAVNFKKDGSYPVTIKGVLTIHNVSRQIEVPGTFIVSGGNVSAKSQFDVALDDYKITIPSLVKDKVSKTAKVTVNCAYTPL